ncbi:hypothetical protein BGW42_000582 [Actinomortierella wolfii]|nr:hypothetical protein BGW42_000582 [Actinomortierella wolfii]
MQELVQHHHKTLKHLWILIRSDHEEQLMEILVHCTQLERLEVQSNAALDIRHLIARPWVCVNLKVLHAPFRHCLASIDPELVNLARSEKEKAAPGKSEYVQTQSLFMFRHGRLTRLRSLDVSQLSGHRYPWEELRWLLPYGLAHLAGLSRLEAICFYGDIPFRIRDLKFMKTHCRSLKMIGCSKIKLIRVQKWLRDNWPQLTVYDGSFTNDRMQSLA